MIPALTVTVLTCVIVWAVRYIREYRAVERDLRSGPFIIDPTPPTLAEISGEFLIPPSMVSRYVINGDGERVWTPGLGQRTCSCPHAATHGHLGGCQLDANPHYAGGGRYADGGPVKGGVSVFLNEYCDYRLATGPRTTLVGPGCQHPNPEPVILTTDEVVAAVCPDCLQPLPPSFVGSEWKP